jgi:hypothetical protein
MRRVATLALSLTRHFTGSFEFAKGRRVKYFLPMSTIEEIKSAIAKLSLEQRAEIIAELCGGTDDDWDRQMKADAAAGKFDALNRN